MTRGCLLKFYACDGAGAPPPRGRRAAVPFCYMSAAGSAPLLARAFCTWPGRVCALLMRAATHALAPAAAVGRNVTAATAGGAPDGRACIDGYKQCVFVPALIWGAGWCAARRRGCCWGALPYC